MNDLFTFQKKVLIPEQEWKTILSDKKKKEPNTAFIRIQQMYDKMQKEKIRKKNLDDQKWEKITNKLGPLFNPTMSDTSASNAVPVSESESQKMDSDNPLDVANYISDEMESKNLTKSHNLQELALRYPDEIQISKHHVKVNGKVLPINTIDLFRNLVGNAKKKLSFAARPFLEILSQEPDLLSCISNKEARAYISKFNRTPEPARKQPVRKKPVKSVVKNLNSLFEDTADDTDDSGDLGVPSASSTPSAKRKKGSGKGKSLGKGSRKIRWVEHF